MTRVDKDGIPCIVQSIDYRDQRWQMAPMDMYQKSSFTRDGSGEIRINLHKLITPVCMYSFPDYVDNLRVWLFNGDWLDVDVSKLPIPPREDNNDKWEAWSGIVERWAISQYKKQLRG